MGWCFYFLFIELLVWTSAPVLWGPCVPPTAPPGSPKAWHSSWSPVCSQLKGLSQHQANTKPTQHSVSGLVGRYGSLHVNLVAFTEVYLCARRLAWHVGHTAWDVWRSREESWCSTMPLMWQTVATTTETLCRGPSGSLLRRAMASLAKVLRAQPLPMYSWAFQATGQFLSAALVA